jgi:glycosyltransferase involved in cell wall biosynthesis
MVVRPSKGGAYGHVARLSSALVDRGHAVAIAGPHGHLQGTPGVEFIELDIGRAVSIAADVRAVGALSRGIRSFRPDLIHAHGSKAGTVARVARLRSLSVPLIFTSHNFAFTNYVGGRARRGAYRVIEQAIAPLATRMLCTCEAERRVATRLVPRRRTRVVYNGIRPFEAIRRDPEFEALGRRGPVVCAVTELQQPKGVETLVEAMPHVLAADPTVTLLVAGDGPLRGRITEQIERLGIGDSVVLLGNVDDVTAVYGAAECFASPGWSESFPYAVLEAMSVGLPIVATDVGGVGEAIEDSVTGRLVAPHSATELAEAICDVLADREAAARLGVAARDRMLARFNFESMLEGTLGVYAELGFE